MGDKIYFVSKDTPKFVKIVLRYITEQDSVIETLFEGQVIEGGYEESKNGYILYTRDRMKAKHIFFISLLECSFEIRITDVRYSGENENGNGKFIL